MSNYPPGVTGNEPQIAGYPEASLSMMCEADDPYVVHLERAGDNIYDLVRRLQGREDLTSSEIWNVIEKLKAEWRSDGYTAPCDWEGDVDGFFATRSLFVWTCPNCGTDNETELD